MVFSGSLITYGRGRAVITGVGRSTELGRIADLMNDTTERKTPLQITMDNFSKKLSLLILIICAIVFGLSLYRGMALADALLFAVALAVAAIPEALASIITISLAIGTSRMADENAIIKELEAVEGLGCVSIICSDKTGTLTQNRMTVEYQSAKEGCNEAMLQASILCNDTAIVDGETKGDPTETAFVDYYMNSHSDYAEVKKGLPRLSELPFDSDRKLMSTLHEIDGKFVMYTKGAIDVILQRSSNLTPEEKQEVTDENFRLSNEGLRVLGFARRVFDQRRDLVMDDEFELEYLGLLAEMDPPREESAQAVKDCIEAGIKPIMITGDHKVTASAIARRIGIFKDGDMAFTGPEIDAMSDEELNEKLEHITVYARVSPDNKIRIVKAWQDRANIVAMTGDGVNDGPALKSADVGVAMGITGTEVAKDSASMILTDDNFATIIKSVLNGRNIYANIKNAIKFLLSGNAAGILAVLYASLAALPMPFTAVQLLFINLITDSLPALAISMEPSNPALIDDKPRPRDESVLNKPTMREICVTGVLIAIATMIAFYIGLGAGVANMGVGPVMTEGVRFGSVTASTMAFSTLCLARLWHGFNCRGREGIFKLGVFTNMFTIGAFALGAILLHLLLLVPVLSKAFNVAMLDPQLLGWVWILSFMPTFIIQVYKAIKFRNEPKRSK
jgi:ATPase, P-type (transporting), HAD superfamily, subfamily IC